MKDEVEREMIISLEHSVSEDSHVLEELLNTEKSQNSEGQFVLESLTCVGKSYLLLGVMHECDAFKGKYKGSRFKSWVAQ